MNVVESTAWLIDRTREREAATGKLASLELQLTSAQEAFGRTNGNPGEFVQARDRVAHLEHQIDQCKQSVGTCQGNVDCAKQGLARAEKQERIDELTTQRTDRRAQASKLSIEALDQYERLTGVLRQLDDLQAADPVDVNELRGLGERVSPFVAANTVWLELMDRNPGKAPAACAYGNLGGRPTIHGIATERGLAVAISPLFEMQNYIPDWLPGLRSNLGDDSMLKSLPKVETPKLAPLESMLNSVSSRSYDGMHYEVACQPVPPNGETKYRLILPSSTMPFDSESIMSEELVELEYGLSARLVTLQGGRRVLLAPNKPSLVARVVDAIVDAASP